jgi:hypothetical protein
MALDLHRQRTSVNIDIKESDPKQDRVRAKTLLLKPQYKVATLDSWYMLAGATALTPHIWETDTALLMMGRAKKYSWHFLLAYKTCQWRAHMPGQRECHVRVS